MFKFILSLTAACILATTAFAQGASYYIPSNSPTNGPCNVIPFGLGSTSTSTTWSNQRYQFMATAADLGNSAVLEICDIAFAPCGTGIKHFDSIEVVMGQTKATKLSTTFSANLVTNIQTVLSAKNYVWHNTADSWNRLGLDKKFLYVAASGPNIVIQITATGSRALGTSYRNGHHSASRSRVFSFGWTAPPTTGTFAANFALEFELVSRRADLHRFGHGCPGSNAQTPALGFTGTAVLGARMSIDVGNCLASAPTLHVVGLTRYPSPIDLTFVGAAGCNLYQSTDIVLGQVTDLTGKYSIKIVVPKDTALVCLSFYTQAFPADSKANRWGRTATNYGRIVPGY